MASEGRGKKAKELFQKKVKGRNIHKMPHPADTSRVAQTGHLTDDSVKENAARVPDVLDLLIYFSSSMGDISSWLETTECYIQAREQLEGGCSNHSPTTGQRGHG